MQDTAECEKRCGGWREETKDWVMEKMWFGGQLAA